MLYSLLYSLHTTYSIFNVFRYISFRTLLGALMALTISFVLGPVLIRRLTANHIGQPIRTDGPARHQVKAGTPTMGGTLILFSLLLSTLLLADLSNPYVWIVLVLVGLIFVVEALSVIAQVAYFRWTGGKRIFLMAPIHHHYELKGWPEPQIIVRFWIISIICALMALSTLKLR